VQAQPENPKYVDSYWQYIQTVMAPVIHKHVPLAKSSPYAKRWRTEDSTQLRRDRIYYRNRARAIRRYGQKDQELESIAKSYKTRFNDTMRQQRKTHWQDSVV
jgi:hypothetical protein